MPAKRMIAEVGSAPKVSGSSRAIAEGADPGQHADHLAHQHPEEAHGEVLEGKGGGEAAASSASSFMAGDPEPGLEDQIENPGRDAGDHPAGQNGQPLHRRIEKEKEGEHRDREPGQGQGGDRRDERAEYYQRLADGLVRPSLRRKS